MKKHRTALLVVIVLLTAAVVIAAGVITLTNPEIPRYHIGAGGESSGGGYTLTGSIGQHDTGVTLTGSEFKLAGGFWGAGGIFSYPFYIPLVIH